jgi:phage shock protein A
MDKHRRRHTMALINRITRLFQADFHAVLDRIEEPEQLLKQAIRDMEEELEFAGKNISLRAEQQQSIAGRKSGLNEKLLEIDAELDLCFESGKDGLARSLVRKKLEGQRLLKRLIANEAANDKFLAEQRTQLDENRSALEGLKQKAEIFAHQVPGNSVTDTDDAVWMARELSVSDDEIEVAFLREQNARRAS